jgi:hypothetical protein
VVLHWVHDGKLSASNVARVVNGRPRWRIAPAALADFLAGRECKPPAPMLRRRRPMKTYREFV